jgi:hypothetical protein
MAALPLSVMLCAPDVVTLRHRLAEAVTAASWAGLRIHC